MTTNEAAEIHNRYLGLAGPPPRTVGERLKLLDPNLGVLADEILHAAPVDPAVDLSLLRDMDVLTVAAMCALGPDDDGPPPEDQREELLRIIEDANQTHLHVGAMISAVRQIDDDFGRIADIIVTAVHRQSKFSDLLGELVEQKLISQTTLEAVVAESGASLEGRVFDLLADALASTENWAEWKHSALKLMLSAAEDRGTDITSLGEAELLGRQLQLFLRRSLGAFVLDTGCWWGLGGARLPAFPGVWGLLWPVAYLRFRRNVGLACEAVDGQLIAWLADLQLQGAQAPFLLNPDAITGPLVRSTPVTYQSPLSLELFQMPVGEDDANILSADPAYQTQWNDAGVKISSDGMLISHRRPGMRYTFEVTQGDLMEHGEGIVLPVGSTVTIRCGDRIASVEIKAAGGRGKGFQLHEGRMAITFDGAGAIVPSRCHCGSERCEERHHITNWRPEAYPFVSLSDFIYNAVKGPIPGRGQGANVGANAFKQSVYNPVLIDAALTTIPPVRSEDIAQFNCPQCPGCNWREETTCPAGHVYDRADSCVKKTGRFFVADWAHFFLKPYGSCKEHNCPCGGECYALSEQLVNARLAVALPSVVVGWTTMTPAQKKQAALDLYQKHPLLFQRAKLAEPWNPPSTWSPICQDVGLPKRPTFLWTRG